MKQINAILLLLLVGSVIALWLLIRPPGEEVARTQEAPSAEYKFRGRFPDYCPPMGALAAAREWPLNNKSPSQDYGPEFLELLDRLTLQDDTKILRLETRSFCIFELDSVLFVLFNDYTDLTVRRVNAKKELLEWLAEKNIEVDICQFVWSQCLQIPDQDPPEPREGEVIERGVRVTAITRTPSLFLTSSPRNGLIDF